MGWGKSAQVSNLGEILDCSQAHGDLVWAWGIEKLLIKAVKGCRDLPNGPQEAVHRDKRLKGREKGIERSEADTCTASLGVGLNGS